MLFVVTAEEIQRLDKFLMEDLGLPPETLMERAGLGVAETVKEAYPKDKINSVIVLCGPGNNGGDGFVCARYLWSWYYDVEVMIISDEKKYTREARKNLLLLKNLGVPVRHLKSLEEIRKYLNKIKKTLIIDGLFGTGLKRPLEGVYGELISLIADLKRERNIEIVAIDIPSGISANTGQILGTAMPADLTVTFECPKIGHFLYPGKDYVGALKVVTIGYPWRYLLSRKDLLPNGIYLDEELACEIYRPRRGFFHKGRAGHLLILAGSQGKSGAGYLTALGALRGGAGLVTIAAPKSLQSIYSSLLPEALTLGLPEKEGEVSFEALDVILENLSGKSCLVIGPGFGLKEDAQRLLFELLTKVSLPVIFDADALTLISKDLSLIQKLTAPKVITPHPGEAGRILKSDAREILKDPLTTLKSLIDIVKGVVVLKGPHTLIGDPSGNFYLSSIDEPGLSQGGTGDVLSGLIGALISQGYSPIKASALGVYLHGASGRFLSQFMGPYGFSASEVANNIPNIIKNLENNYDGQKKVSQIPF